MNTLTRIVTVIYVAAWVIAAILLIAIPAGRVLSGTDAGPSKFRVHVPVTIPHLESTTKFNWGGSPSETRVEELRGQLAMPVNTVAASLLTAIWLGLAIAAALILSFLFHLRQLFLRVRDRVPFDERNAARLRWMGMLLLVLGIFGNAFRSWVSAHVVKSISTSSVDLDPIWHIDLSLPFMALILLALAEVFRHGTALEDEQSLVV